MSGRCTGCHGHATENRDLAEELAFWMHQGAYYRAMNVRQHRGDTDIYPGEDEIDRARIELGHNFTIQSQRRKANANDNAGLAT
jgi:hypothetical protein